MTSVEHLPEICSSYEENDVRIIIYIKYIQTTMSHIKIIRVRSKDSDIFILLYVTKSFTVEILMDTGEKLFNISHLADNYSQEHIAAMLALHAFTGADCTLTFKGKAKVRPLKLLSQNSKFIHIFAAVGSTWTLDNDYIVTGIEEFTCRLYGVGPRVKQVDVAREIKVKNISTFGLVSPLISPNVRPADGFSPNTSRESITMSVSGTGLSIIFQKYRPLLTMVIM